MEEGVSSYSVGTILMDVVLRHRWVKTNPASDILSNCYVDIDAFPFLCEREKKTKCPSYYSNPSQR